MAAAAGRADARRGAARGTVRCAAPPQAGRAAGRELSRADWETIRRSWPAGGDGAERRALPPLSPPEDVVVAVTLEDARAARPPPALWREGFELCRRPSEERALLPRGATATDGGCGVTEAYLRAVEAMVVEHTGAVAAAAYHHNRRLSSLVVPAGGAPVAHDRDGRAGPVERAHCDLLPRHARGLARELEASGRLPPGASGGALAALSVWRPVDRARPVLHKPLALLDRRTADAADAVQYHLVSGDEVGTIALLGAPREAGGARRAAPRRRWLRYPQMTCDEALLVLQYDGRRAGAAEEEEEEGADSPYCGGAFHAAAEVLGPEGEDEEDDGVGEGAGGAPPPPRDSCEVRVIAAYGARPPQP